LDVRLFQQYKHYHGKAVNQAARYIFRAFKEREFLEALPRIRADAFKPSTIISGFSDREAEALPYRSRACITDMGWWDSCKPINTREERADFGSGGQANLANQGRGKGKMRLQCSAA
jgi:hypothetical protein